MASAFTLGTDERGLATLIFDLPGRSVNIFTREVIAELEELVEELSERQDIRALALLSGKPGNFIAGADIDLIASVQDPAEAEEGCRRGQRLFSAWQALPFPTLAAVRGTCMGGGTELALACDRIAISDRDEIRIGLPEVRLGILPAWGGCTRLPRRIEVVDALDLILAGKALPPRKALRVGLADFLLPEAAFLSLLRRALETLADGSAPGGRRARHGLKRLVLEGNPIGRRVLFDQARKRLLAKTGGHYPAPLRAVEVIRAGVEAGLEAGLEAEARAAGELAVSPVCKNLIHVFRLMEEAKRPGQEAEAVAEAAVLGAGVMGGGIAQLIALKARVPVRLKDIALEPLARGLAHAAKLFSKQVERKRLTRAQAQAAQGLLRPTLAYDGFDRVDLVVEAVVENLEVKRQVFRDLEEAVPESAVLATNTSSIPIDRIAEGLKRPGRCIGMHFFNPVERMPLLEIIPGSRTDADAVETATAFARRLGKTPVVVSDTPGFLVNRLLFFSLSEALWLLDGGYPIEEIDRPMRAWGMPMGPLELADAVGIDVAAKVAPVLLSAFPGRLQLPAWLDRLVESGRLGAKSGLGFYRHEKGRSQSPDPGVYELLGIKHRGKHVEPTEVVDRIVLPMVNEAARCLDEGVVGSAAQVDLAMILGTGFPPFRGGLCRWADREGVTEIRATLEALANRVDRRFAPASSLDSVCEAGGFYSAFPTPEGV